MSIPVPIQINSILQNTNGSNFKVLTLDHPVGAPMVAMDIVTGEIQFFYMDGVADNILHANLIVSVSTPPVNEDAPNLTLTQGGLYRSRDGRRIAVDHIVDTNHFQVKDTRNVLDLFGYTVWTNGMYNNDGTRSNNDLLELWSDPLASQMFWCFADTTAPTDSTKWTNISSTRPGRSSVPLGHRLIAVFFREPDNDTQNFSLNVKYF